MTEAQLVPYPHMFPSACFWCGTQSGTMVDTHVERPGIGRLYLCTKLCAPAVARAAGLVEGERMEQLLGSAVEIERLEQDIARREEDMHAMREQLAGLRDLVELRDGELEQERGRTQMMVQLGESIADTAEQLRGAIASLHDVAVEPVIDPDGNPADDEETDVPEPVGGATASGMRGWLGMGGGDE